MNSIKYSEAEKISLSIEAGKGAAYSFTIEDNGKGFERQEHYHDHYGLENMMHRSLESGAELVINSELSKGTKVIIKKTGTISAGDRI
jgi:nitrate/nitrite-specific signal transduction histidine kinase